MSGAFRLDPLLLEEFALDPWQLLVVATGFSVNQTLGATTLSAAANDPVSATESTTLGAVTLAATATAPKADASLSQTLGAATVAATATHPDSASLSQTLGAVTSAATATVPDNAAVSQTLGVASVAATATTPEQAQLAATLGDTTVVATATVAGSNLSLNETLGAVSVAATATDPVSAALDATLGATGVSATATAPDTASLAATLGDVTVAATATQNVVSQAQLAQTLGDVSVSATATDPVQGGLSETLGAVGVTATATDPLFATASNTLGPVTSAATAKVPDAAQLAATLGDVAVVAAFTSHDIAPPASEAPLVSARPDPIIAVARRQGATFVVGQRQSQSPPIAQRNGGLNQVAIGQAAAGELTVCRLGTAILNAFRPSRGQGHAPVTRNARLIGSLDAVTLSASAQEIAPVPNDAVLSESLGATTLQAQASATFPADFTADLTLGPATADANLITGSVPTARTATLSASLAPATADGQASAPPSADGTVSASLGDATVSGHARNRVAAVVSKVLGAVSLHAAAHFPRVAQLVQSLGGVTLSASSGSGRVRGATVVNVADFGALGNGVHDDTAAFNNAIAALPAGGGTVKAEPGKTYMIDALIGVKPKSKMLLDLNGGTLQAFPNSADGSYVVLIELVNNVEVAGGTIIGDRLTHTGTTGEGGHCIRVRGATQVSIHNMTLQNGWGDGLCVGPDKSHSTAYVYSQDVVVANVVCDGNRRNGMSIGNVIKMRVNDSHFINTGLDPDGAGPIQGGTSPRCGIDVEPDGDANGIGYCDDVIIDNCLMSGNAVYGINFFHRAKGTTVQNCLIEQNLSCGAVSNGSTGTKLLNNVIRDNVSTGLFWQGDSTDGVSIGNTFAHNYTKSPYPNYPNGTDFDQVGTSSKTDKDLLVGPTPVNCTPGLNHYLR